MKKYKLIEIKEYEKMLSEISLSESIDLNNYDLLLYGGGGQSKSFYRNLQQNSDYQVLWTGWAGPKWSSILSFIPGQAGLIKVVNQQAFKELYYKLAAYSVSEVLYVPKSLTLEIVDDVRKKNWKIKFEKFIDKASESFLLTSEADEAVDEKGKGMYFIDYCFGEKVSTVLKDIVERKTNT
ncbi:hypothetical protein ABID22_002121 [Pontibacter aydingkolensis]|uniref:Uncharacterized protein n=1 Tax=Pontibacter aydingkolensis TaxID=1911536 RepID=A0ABS7CVA4_9BACT|nr:hypothetical protein [Pontibacter aydingkolensis]MBW7467737.1 hypothetical protein [Pontibacter aydingkolensis]